jgi:hypothetical protein
MRSSGFIVSIRSCSHWRKNAALDLFNVHQIKRFVLWIGHLDLDLAEIAMVMDGRVRCFECVHVENVFQSFLLFAFGFSFACKLS